MAIIDYGSLKTAIAGFAHRTDLAAVMDLFVDSATERLGVDLKVIENEVTADLTATAGAYTLPADFRELRYVDGVTSGIIEPFTATDANQFIDSASRAAGYIMGGNLGLNLTLIPTTDEDLTVDYWQVPSSLVADTDANPILTAYSHLYLAASMIEVGAYIVSTEITLLWQAKYDSGVAKANDRATKARYGVGLHRGPSARFYNNTPSRAM